MFVFLLITTRITVFVFLSDLGLLCSYYYYYYYYFSLVETWSLVAPLFLFILLASFLLLC